MIHTNCGTRHDPLTRFLHGLSPAGAVDQDSAPRDLYPHEGQISEAVQQAYLRSSLPRKLKEAGLTGALFEDLIMVKLTVKLAVNLWFMMNKLVVVDAYLWLMYCTVASLTNILLHDLAAELAHPITISPATDHYSNCWRSIAVFGAEK